MIIYNQYLKSNSDVLFDIESCEAPDNHQGKDPYYDPCATYPRFLTSPQLDQVQESSRPQKITNQHRTFKEVPLL
ncbi:hypothetical protein AVEN_253068-1 [Araneus ventricosus]|uniref:Uncharacterized protein n=1 Tax=Araneus ventricosus TaxID=182803 RepID=A0A4Y2MI78_ARAVE|nr:hypothetical protein AVEN_253068-1 [Araneus ventricosus]